MNNTATNIKDRENLQMAADMKIDFAIPSLCQLIGYRQKVAQDILGCKDEEQLEYLNSVYDRANYHIKQLLGI
jgi:hypothetical protein